MMDMSRRPWWIKIVIYFFCLISFNIKRDRTCDAGSDLGKTLYASTAPLEKVDRATQSNENVAILWRVPVIPMES
jgi:hypothetical protein